MDANIVIGGLVGLTVAVGFLGTWVDNVRRERQYRSGS